MQTTSETGKMFEQFADRAVETLTLWADANQQLLRNLADLSARTAEEGVRLVAELQASAVEAVKEGQAYCIRRQGTLDAWPADPMAWCQRGLVEGTEQTQKAFKLLEGNAQAVARSAERVQATAQQAAREIQQTFAAAAAKAKTLYAPTQN